MSYDFEETLETIFLSTVFWKESLHLRYASKILIYMLFKSFRHCVIDSLIALIAKTPEMNNTTFLSIAPRQYLWYQII